MGQHSIALVWSSDLKSEDAVMDEVFPVLAGVALGLAFHHIGSRLRIVLLAVLALAFGVVASWISGELAISWVYILIDTAQVLSAAVLTATLVMAWRRRAAWYRPRP
jgi:hypothetical protein